MSSILTTTALSKSYGKLQAVNALNLQIDKGVVFGLLGPNGSGKSTTLGMVMDIVNPDSGSYSWFDGTEATKDSRKRIGAMLEQPNFYPYLSAEKNLGIVAEIKRVDKSRIPIVLERVGLSHRATSAFKTYSTGMKQRLALAATLLSDPEVLILDEPTNGLDPQGIADIRELIIDIAREGKTIILASHILDEVEKVCTHAAIIKNGVLLEQGPVRDIMRGAGSGGSARPTAARANVGPDTAFDGGQAATADVPLEFFELLAADFAGLEKSIVEHPHFLSKTRKDGNLVVRMSEDMDGAEINRFLMERNIYLSHLVMRKQRLEEKFLEITSR